MLLRDRLDDQTKQYEATQKKYLTVYEEKLMLESSLSSLNEGHPIEG